MFGTSGSDGKKVRMTIDSGQDGAYVGIGNNYPQNAAHLTVEGNISQSGNFITQGHITASGNISGSSTSTGSLGYLTIEDKIQRSGDTDTFINFANNKQIFSVGGIDILTLQESTSDEVIVGDGSNSVTFRVKTPSETDTILVDPTTKLVGFGKSPGNKAKVDVDGNIRASGAITASGNISSSGTLISNEIDVKGHITASGNYSGSATSTIVIGGKLSAGSKSFLIPNPEGGKLEYGVLEGQQNDVFYRGKLKGDNVIHLPKEWEWLVDENTITVQLTSIEKYQQLYVKEIKNNKIFINISGMFKTKENIHCYYIIHGTRKDIELIRNYQ